MTADDFRTLALQLPEASEEQHMNHPDFRVRGKIFATLGPGGEWGMVKLTPAEQKQFVRLEPKAFEPFAGAWGQRGSTKVHLAAVTELIARQALIAAWRNTAPRKLVREQGLSEPEA